MVAWSGAGAVVVAAAGVDGSTAGAPGAGSGSGASGAAPPIFTPSLTAPVSGANPELSASSDPMLQLTRRVPASHEACERFVQ